MCTSGRRAAWAEGGAAKENRFPFYQDFVSYVFDSTLSPRLHKHPGVELFKLHSLVLLIYNSTASDKEKNLKCSAPFKQQKKPVVTGWRMRDLFFHHPMMHTHTPHGVWEAPEKLAHRLTVVCKRVQPPAPPPRVRSTKHEKQNLSGTSLLQTVVISHLSAAWITLPGPQGTISSIRFGLRVPTL